MTEKERPPSLSLSSDARRVDRPVRTQHEDKGSTSQEESSLQEPRLREVEKGPCVPSHLGDVPRVVRLNLQSGHVTAHMSDSVGRSLVQTAGPLEAQLTDDTF